MLQKDKVAIMTRLAMEEKKSPRYGFITRSYWFDDYISLEMWKAFFAISVTFALAVLLGLVAYGDDWTVRFHLEDMKILGIKLLTVYASTLIIGILLCALSHVWLYKKAFRRQERIKGGLRRLNRIYSLEEALERLKERESAGADEGKEHE